MKFLVIPDALYSEIARWRALSEEDRDDTIGDIVDDHCSSARVILRILADEDLTGLKVEDVLPALALVESIHVHPNDAVEVWDELPEPWKHAVEDWKKEIGR